MKKVYILYLLVLGVSLNSNAQLKEVSSNRLEFIEDLTKHMTFHKKKEGKKFIEEFNRIPWFHS